MEDFIHFLLKEGREGLIADGGSYLRLGVLR